MVIIRAAFCALLIGTAGSIASSSVAPAADGPAAGAVQAGDAQKLLAELKSAAKTLNDIASRAPSVVEAMFKGKADVAVVLALSDESDKARRRLEEALKAAVEGGAVSPELIKRIGELAAAADASSRPVKADTQTLRVVVKTAGLLGGENFAVRQTPVAKQQQGLENAKVVAKDVGALTAAILSAALPDPSASAPPLTNSNAASAQLTNASVVTERPASQPDAQAAAAALAAKAAAAREAADAAQVVATAARATAATAQNELDGIATILKGLQEQQKKIAKMKHGIEATPWYGFQEKISRTHGLIRQLDVIANGLTALSNKSLVAHPERQELKKIASQMRAKIAVMRQSMSFIPDENKIRAAGQAMEKMTPGINKLVAELFSKAAGEIGRLQADADDAAGKAKQSGLAADKLAHDVQALPAAAKPLPSGMDVPQPVPAQKSDPAQKTVPTPAPGRVRSGVVNEIPATGPNNGPNNGPSSGPSNSPGLGRFTLTREAIAALRSAAGGTRSMPPFEGSVAKNSYVVDPSK